MAVKPLLNWSRSLMLIRCASYSASSMPRSSNSSSIMVTFTPFGVAREYSCSGCFPTGSSRSYLGPASGRFMLANGSSLSALQVQTLGGTYWRLVIHLSRVSETNTAPLRATPADAVGITYILRAVLLKGRRLAGQAWPNQVLCG